ncbi:head decoration protein [Agrobacterium rhizogenes]|uniref:head decoration protein n=1 Tax=Rhizobium rhizogenes TaxID=359 RepID=UPI0015729262|nr:head decoration protein [Rhizobium rhizogenes]NTF87502.1 head decoration protein [Rhizobium rhizogenes]
MTQILSDDRHTTASYIVSEANGFRSREVGIVASGSGKLKAGTVLGKSSLGAATAAAKSGGNTGNGTISAVTLLVGAKVGVYRLRFTAATAWTLVDPDGFDLGAGANGVANANDLAFTTTAGGTAFVAGDGFDITVAAAGGNLKPLAPAATDGTQTAAAILFEGCDATSADVRRTYTARDTEVQADMLTWPVGITDTQKNAALASLAALGIIAR